MSFIYVGFGLLTNMGNLSPVMQETLIDLYVHGANIPANIGDNIDRHANSVSRALRKHTEDENSPTLVRNKGRGVWTLTDRGEEVAERLAAVEELALEQDEPDDETE